MTVDIDKCCEDTERSEAGTVGSVMGGSTGCKRPDTKVSLMREVIMEVLPVPSSPQTHIRTAQDCD